MKPNNYPADNDEAEERFETNMKILAMVSHEIRNPLNAIIGLSHLLKMPSSEKEHRYYLDSLSETSENLLELVNNIMDFSKLNSGKLPVISKATDLRKLIQQGLAGQKAIAESHGLRLDIEFDPDLPSMLLTDPVKINQVVLNLVSNAIKFTKQGSIRVSIEVERIESMEALIRFRVTDTGIGIPREKMDFIFEAFHQGGEDINLKYGGTGLGLNISQQVIRSFGGELNVKSTVGRGTEFNFAILMEIDRNSESGLPANESSPAAFFKYPLRVLVVDDNKLSVLILRKYLEAWGFQFEVAYNGPEAVQIVQGKGFDLILMDLHMPGMDGFATTQVIRNLPELRSQEVPIIGLTASTENTYLEKMKSAGFSDFLLKPFQPKQLLDKMISAKRELV